MTNPINYQNQSNTPYSGITINITNPTINPPMANPICPPNCNMQNIPTQQVSTQHSNIITNDRMSNPNQYGITNPNDQIYNYGDNSHAVNNSQDNKTSQAQAIEKTLTTNTTTNNEALTQKSENAQEGIPQAYPPQYYLNNYNYIQNGEKGNTQTVPTEDENKNQSPSKTENITPTQANDVAQTQVQEEDLSSSKEIINELDARVAEQKELEKNGKQTKVIALTNEYIMSLENYLNNPNTEIRLMAAKEVLTRLDEDKNRFDDAALNALLNKMLQDPEKLVRIAALSAFSSQLASGNDYTITLLTKIQNNPNADKEDALQAADSLLKMSSRTEIRYTPIENSNIVEQPVEQ